MSLRVTQDYVEALSTGAGALRVTQTYVQALILVDVWEPTAESVISLNQDALPGLYAESVSQTLDLVSTASGFSLTNRLTQILDIQQAVHESLHTIDVGTTILLSQATHVSPIRQSVTTVISLTDSALPGLYTEFLTQSMILVQTVGDGSPRYVTATSVISMSDNADISTVSAAAESVLELIQDVSTPAILYLSPQTELFYVDPDTLLEVGLTQEPAIISFGIASRDIITYLNIQSEVHRANDFNVTTELNLVSECFDVIETIIQLEQTVHIDVGYGIYQTIDLVGDVAEVNVDAARSAASVLELVQEVGWVTAVDLCGYAPQGGLPPAPTLGHATLTLTYPFVSPTSTLVLRNPEFNNKRVFTVTRINRQTRGGTLVIFSDPIWLKRETLQLEVANLKASQAADMLLFLRASLGKQIGLLDHENRQWRGIILNPLMPIAHEKRNGRRFELEFEGELV